MSAGERIRPTCPECGGHDVREVARIEAYYYIGLIEPGEDGDLDKASCDYWDSAYGDDGEFVSYECRGCGHEAGRLGEFVPGTEAKR
jgi:hypothetical protein